MATALLVPVHLDALHCPTDKVVVQPTADFGKLPFCDGTRDVHPDVAQISEEIVARPFQDETALLRTGVHLHWALPDALTRGKHRATGKGTEHRTRFPVVPNRWLVRRTVPGQPERAWVVESDYLHPDGTGETNGVAVPFPAAPEAGRYTPYRFLGRVVARELWRSGEPGEYLPNLTAVGFDLGTSGYSDPAFAALYANCHSVFGFHDTEIGATLPIGLRYDLLGWYGTPGQDFLNTVLAEARSAGTEPPKQLEQYAGWTYTGPEFPERTVCYASLGFRPALAAGPAEPAMITIGNTGTEALSVALAARLNLGRRFEIEDRLEAIQLAPRIEHRTVDVDDRFRAARHEKGFTAHRGNALWSVRPKPTTGTALPADAERGQNQAEIALPPDLAGLLAVLNEAQRDRDRAATELDSARRQLFADWYKYLLCAYPPEDTGEDYPDIDEVRAFLETHALPRIHERAGSLEPAPDTPEGRLRAAYAAAVRALDGFNATERLRDASLAYELNPLVGPRFWQPTDPVVLIAGDDVTASQRHGQDGRLRADVLLSCQAVPSAVVTGIIDGNLAALTTLMDDLRRKESEQDGTVAFRDSDGSPWNPFQLEWEVELFPLREQGNIHPEVDSYGPDFVTANYTLTGHDPDLVRTGEPAVTGAASVYSGASFLTRNAGERLTRSLAEYLRKEALPEFNEATGRQPAVTDPGPVIAELRAWYEKTYPSEVDSQAHDAIRAYQDLLGMNYLAQSLGGFNDALLMHRQVKQLPIGDPLGFEEDRAFAETVAAEIGTSNRSAPEPLNDFNPIRSGAMRLLRLRLVDTFGQTREVPVDRVLPAATLTTAGSPGLITLPPRLSQPARVVFRWLAADQDLETNDHPETSPVCGWILPNHVETSLMVYDGDGRALGSLDSQARWQPAPGGTGVPGPAQIRNRHLSTTVAGILAHGPEFLDRFLAALDGALGNIEPESSDTHVDLAVLVGRPIALVRAALDLELLGLPAIHQGWNQFRQDLARGTRDSDGFTRVGFPVRLGAYRQLDDGLIGYWVGEDDTFHSPQADGFGHAKIHTYADGPLHVDQAIDDPTRIVRMLVDPRGKVHITSGVQPVKTIGIPPGHYATAMGELELTFPCTALLTDLGAINPPLPVEAGYRWAWVSRADGGWAEITAAPVIGREAFTGALAGRVWEHLVDPHVGWLRPVPSAAGRFWAMPPGNRTGPLDPEFRALAGRIEPILAGAETLELDPTIARLIAEVAGPAWNALLDEETGWLRAAPGGAATVTPKDSRPRPVLTGDLAGTEPLLERLLDLGAKHLGPPTTTATFAPQELRDGWLTLRRTEPA